MAIVAAVDGGPNSDNVVEVGYDLATTYEEQLHAIHVIPESKFESRSESSPDYYRDDAQQDAATVATRVVEDAMGSSQDIQAVGRVGNSANEVLKFVEEVEPRYLVTGGRRRSPVGKAVFGSDAQEILLNSTIPVVTVMGPTDAPE